MLSAGGSFEWFCDTFGEAELARVLREANAAVKRGDLPELTGFHDLMTGLAAGAPPGSEGLLFLPYLTGERTPHADPLARGAFVGLTPRHGLGHLTRAVLEGVTYGLRDSFELMRGLGLTINQVRASGGGTRSPLWRQILADVFDTEIVTVNVTQGAAFGAALLAGVGIGMYASVTDACERVIQLAERHEPGPDAAVYADFYPRYRALYPALADEFAAITKIVAARRSVEPQA